MRFSEMAYLGELSPEQEEIAELAPFGTDFAVIVQKAVLLETHRNHFDAVVVRGEQPDSTALPDAGALRGDAPLSSKVKEAQ